MSAGTLRIAVAASRTADHHQPSLHVGAQQPGLIEDRVGGAADQRAENVERDARVTGLEVGGLGVVVLEAAIR